MRVRRVVLAAFVVLMSLQSRAMVAQPFKLPPEWSGNMQLSLLPDNTVGVLTLDAVGGYLDSKPGSEPEGTVDWMFPVFGLSSVPPAISGPVTLRLPPGRASFMDYLEVVQIGRPPIVFKRRASTVSIQPENPSASVVNACGIFRAFPRIDRHRNHADTAKEFLDELVQFQKRTQTSLDYLCQSFDAGPPH